MQRQADVRSTASLWRLARHEGLFRRRSSGVLSGSPVVPGSASPDRKAARASTAAPASTRVALIHHLKKADRPCRAAMPRGWRRWRTASLKLRPSVGRVQRDRSDILRAIQPPEGIADTRQRRPFRGRTAAAVQDKLEVHRAFGRQRPGSRWRALAVVRRPRRGRTPSSTGPANQPASRAELPMRGKVCNPHRLQVTKDAVAGGRHAHFPVSVAGSRSIDQ